MTTQLANLVHTRFQYRNRRVTCGAMLTAATLVAVVLFLATTASTSATGPCDGLSTVVVTATGSDTTSGSSAAPSANCDFSVKVTPPAAGGASGAAGAAGATAPEPCVVTATPRTETGRGTTVQVRTSGNCDGVRLRTSVNIGPPPPNPPSSTAPSPPADASVSGSAGSAAASLSNGVARAELTAWHYLFLLPDLKMFWHYARATWSYSPVRISSASMSTDFWEGGCGWTLDRESELLWLDRLNTRFAAKHVTGWSAGCGPLPDATADSTASVIVRPAGAFSCLFDTDFDGGVVGFGYDGSCLDS